MRWIITILLLLCSTYVTVQTQTADSAATRIPQHWYDTLTVTQPKQAKLTKAEQMALAAFSAISLPVGFFIGGITVMPPSVEVLHERDTVYYGLSLSTGIGFGQRGNPLLYYPEVRFQFEASGFVGRQHPFVYRVEACRDFPVVPVHRKKIVWLSTALGAGISSDFHSAPTPYLTAFAGISNPLGIRFIGLYPMHNVGLRLRVGRDFGEQKNWYEASLCATSNFGWFQ